MQSMRKSINSINSISSIGTNSINGIGNSIGNSISNVGHGISKIGNIGNINKKKSTSLNYYTQIPNNNNSRIREIIYEINEDRHIRQTYESYEFLILLTDDYFKKKIGIFPSKKYYIKKSKFPGKLEIEKYSQLAYSNNNYSFESNPIPNQLYIKLQKERVFVLYSEYEQKVLESKFNEFFDILTVIGAKYIKISKKMENIRQTEIETSVGANMDVGLTCKNGVVCNKAKYQNENESSLTVKQEMSFNNSKDPVLNKLLDNHYYYLPKQMDLQQLIIRRIENNLVSDRFIYNHYEQNLLNMSVITSLHKLNIGLNYKLKTISNFQIEYEILFNNIKDTQLNLIYDDDETPWLYKTISNFINRFYLM
jgi:hypothetical protein